MRNSKKIGMLALLCVGMLFTTVSCASQKGFSKTSAKVEAPALIDHQYMKWGKEPPEWITQQAQDLEQLSKYKDEYVFKFESPRSKSLEGAKLWTQDFSVPREMARSVEARIQNKAAAAAAGDKDKIDGYLEDIVKVVSNAKLTGFRKRDEYWILMRYFDTNRQASDEFTYEVLYSISKETLDRMVQDALNEADKKPAKTAEEKTVRDHVKKALSEGL